MSANHELIGNPKALLSSRTISDVDLAEQPLWAEHESSYSIKIDILKLSLAQLELNFLKLQKDFLEMSTSLKIDYEETLKEKNQLIDQYSKINTARLNVIKEQSAFIKNFSYLQSMKRRVKTLFAPRLGILYQYDSRAIRIPVSYSKTVCKGEKPLISIVTPSYNQGDFLEQTITSVTIQEYDNLEYFIQDGGSSDNSVEIIQEYESFLTGWVSEKDEGQSHALNLGFERSTGSIMAYLNSDDLLLPGTLHYVANYFMEHPEIDVIYGHRIVIDEYDHEIGRWVLPPHDDRVLEYVDYIPQETLFWRREIWERVGSKIDENFKFAMDWDLINRFQKVGAKFSRLPRFLGAFRAHKHQKTSIEIRKAGDREMNKIRLRCHKRYISHMEIMKNIRWYKVKHLIYHWLYKCGIVI